MKYFNIKRYKFSTITSTLRSSLESILDFRKIIDVKKIFNYFNVLVYISKKTIRYFDPRRYNIINTIKKVNIKNNRFLFYHLPATIIFFAFVYIIIPTFYIYEKSKIQKLV